MFSVLFRFYSRFNTTGKFRLASDEKNGPKVRFFFFPSCFCILSILFRFYLCFTSLMRVRAGSRDKNGPK